MSYNVRVMAGGDLMFINNFYNRGLKQLLGVRITAINTLCCTENGYPALTGLVSSMMRFWGRIWQERQPKNHNAEWHLAATSKATEK